MKLRYASTPLLFAVAAVSFSSPRLVRDASAAPLSEAGARVVMTDSAASTSATSGSATSSSAASGSRSSVLATKAKAALAALSSAVRPLSDSRALQDAFHSYFAFKLAHPQEVKKPYLYFVDYGLPNTQPRGYVFDMSALRIVEGPFTVAHGRGSAPSGSSIPTRFSNAIGSAATSLGLYLAKATYGFIGTSGGRHYHSIGLQLDGVSDGFNDNALVRRVVAHGAPYVTPARAGSSEGCPAMEPSRAKRLLPKLADGGMVFLFAPNSNWMNSDPWIAAD